METTSLVAMSFGYVVVVTDFVCHFLATRICDFLIHWCVSLETSFTHNVQT